MVIFNGGNNNLYIQFNFVIISIFFLLLTREKNYFANMMEIFLKNKLAIKLYFLFIIFLIFQTIPLPIEWLTFLSPEKYNILDKLEFKGNFNSIYKFSPLRGYSNLRSIEIKLIYISLFKCIWRNFDEFIFNNRKYKES